jgi:hypothetical protein
MAFLVIATPGCASSGSGNVFEVARYPSARIRALTVQVALQDARTKVSQQRSVDTPIITMPDDHGEAREIPLAPEAVEAMQERMRRLLGHGTARVRVLVTLVEGRSGWKSNWIHEIAFTRAKVQVEVFYPAIERAIVTATGQAWAELSSIDTSDREVADLFDRAVIRAFEEAITQPDFVRMINDALDQLNPVLEAVPASKPLQQLQSSL